MAGIQTSKITTAAADDLVLDPATGKQVQVKSVDATNPGETPVSVNADGTVKRLDVSSLTELTDADAGDYIVIQAGTARADDSAGTTVAGNLYKIDGENIGGGKPADPNPSEILATPDFLGGTGTLSDPFIVTPATVSAPGGTAVSEQELKIAFQKTFVPVPISDLTSGAGTRFAQPSGTTDQNGEYVFKLYYNDSPETALGDGQVYNGSIKIGSSSIYLKWDVTQIANLTQLGPVSSPTASPTTVNYAADGKYGTVSGKWADGARTLEATNMVFSVNGGTFDGSSKTISDGDAYVVGFDDAVVASANEGDTIAGVVKSTDGVFYSAHNLNKKTSPNAFTIQPGVDRDTSAEASTGNEAITGVNAPATISAAGTSASPLTDVKVSINGGARATVTNGTFIPGDKLQGFGTTGGDSLTTYQATFTIGGVSSTWDVTTADSGGVVAQPSIISPVNGGVDLSPEFDLISDEFTVVDGTDTHQSSTWEVYETSKGGSVPLSPISSVEGLIQTSAISDVTVDGCGADFANRFLYIDGYSTPTVTRKTTKTFDGNSASGDHSFQVSFWTIQCTTPGDRFVYGPDAPYTVVFKAKSGETNTDKHFVNNELPHELGWNGSGLKESRPYLVLRSLGGHGGIMTTQVKDKDGLVLINGKTTVTLGGSINIGQLNVGDRVLNPHGYDYSVIKSVDSANKIVELDNRGWEVGDKLVTNYQNPVLVLSSADNLDKLSVGDTIAQSVDGNTTVYSQSIVTPNPVFDPLMDRNGYRGKTGGYKNGVPTGFTNWATSVDITVNSKLEVYCRMVGGSSPTSEDHVTVTLDGTKKGIADILPETTGAYNTTGSNLEWLDITAATDAVGKKLQAYDIENSDSFQAEILGFRVDDILLADPVYITGKVKSITIAGSNGATENKVALENATGLWTVGNTPIISIPADSSAPAPSTEPPGPEYLRVVNSVEDTNNLESYTLTESDLKEDKSYFARVKYHAAGGAEDSEFSEYTGFDTAGSFLARPGGGFKGGYFVAQVNENGVVYDLVIAPKNSEKGGVFKPKNNVDSPSIAENKGNGKPATLQFADGDHPLYNSIVYGEEGPNSGVFDDTNSLKTGIGGFNDWYLPADNELDLILSNLATGDSRPPVFQPGGPQTFNGDKYWSSTQDSGDQSYQHAYLLAGSGPLGQDFHPKNQSARYRAVRRDPA